MNEVLTTLNETKWNLNLIVELEKHEEINLSQLSEIFHLKNQGSLSNAVNSLQSLDLVSMRIDPPRTKYVKLTKKGRLTVPLIKQVVKVIEE